MTYYAVRLALFSALTALIKLHGLDVATARQAFGIAGSMASGLRRNFGTMTKPLHTGLAARSAWTDCKTRGFEVTYWQADERGRWQRRE